MLVKGTEEYKRAQEIATKITRQAANNKYFNPTAYERAFDRLGAFLTFVEFGEFGFASDIARTIGASMGKGELVARVSDKQAWIIACAAVEKGMVHEFLGNNQEECKVIIVCQEVKDDEDNTTIDSTTKNFGKDKAAAEAYYEEMVEKYKDYGYYWVALYVGDDIVMDETNE